MNPILRLSERVFSSFLSQCARKSHSLFWDSKAATVPSNVTIAEIGGFLDKLDVQPNPTFFVHSSWLNLNSGEFSAPELLKYLIEKVGNAGTLAMPAFPISQDPSKVFDVRKTPSGAGLLTEVFRRYPGTRRSISLNHSICAYGKDADLLTGEHHLEETSWGVKSPYFKLSENQNAWIIGLGVGHRLKIATALHCVESILREEVVFFSKLFGKRVAYNYLNAEGERGVANYRPRKGIIYTPKIAKHFTAQELNEDTIGGLDVYAIRADVLVKKAIELGRRGDTMYVWPIPFPWLFTNEHL